MYKDLRDVRYQNGDLTQKEMAKRIGISIAAYSLIEQKKRVGSNKTWKKIQELFKLSDADVWRFQNQQRTQQIT